MHRKLTAVALAFVAWCLLSGHCCGGGGFSGLNCFGGLGGLNIGGGGGGGGRSYGPREYRRAPPPAPPPAPLSMGRLIVLCRERMNEWLLVDEIRRGGILFIPTPEDIRELQSVGASDEVIRAVLDAPVRACGCGRCGRCGKPLP